MANYMGTTKTNYFKVNNKEKAELILSSIFTDGEFYFDINETENEGIFECWFGSTGNIMGIPKNYQTSTIEDEDEEEDYDLMITELQSILTDDTYITLIEVGYEKLCYVNGSCLVITKNKTKFIDLMDMGDAIGKELLNQN